MKDQSSISKRFLQLLSLLLVLMLVVGSGVQQTNAAEPPPPLPPLEDASVNLSNDPIDGASTWNLGATVASTFYNCEPPHLATTGTEAYVGQWRDSSGERPVPGEPYWLLVVVEGIGDSCDAQSATIYLDLPAGTSLSISGSTPVRCWKDDSPFSAGCPDVLPVSTTMPGSYELGKWWTETAVPNETRKYEFHIPVVSSGTLSGDNFEAVIVMDDGNSDPWLTPTIGVNVYSLPLPNPFNKKSPVHDSITSTNPTLEWWGSGDAASFEYCVDTIDNDVCDTAWVSTGLSLSALQGLLNSNTYYYWQVRARNSSGDTYANGGTWWRFFTLADTVGDTAGLYDPATGIWRLKAANTWNAPVTYLQWGNPAWTPVAGDWDSDGDDEVGLYDPGTGIWRLKSANTWNGAVTYLQWGASGWLPVAGDWDNDGYDEVGLYDPATGIWRFKSENTWNAPVTYLQWGNPGWIPVTGDWDNDGYDEVGHYDPSSQIWRLKSTNTWNGSVTYLQWGTSGWTPISGDWDGDGYDEVGSYHPITTIWRLKFANTWDASVTYLQWGNSGWEPVSGEW